MTLPPPDPAGNVFWKEYQVNTPAFQLSPLEKPDMSPYLVHMTGKQAIHGILNSEVDGGGKIHASIPQVAGGWYDSPVVCFTESPLFAIDAFRYIKFQRWKDDMRYGVGFSKEKLVSRGVRPVLYADASLVTLIKGLRDNVNDVQPEPLRKNIQKLVEAAIPLMNSLMEYEQKQGFIWEREWRHPDPEGFDFDYNDIEIICCPEEERQVIAQQLGEHTNRIKFVSSWSQYDDVKAFLKSRATGWQTSVISGDRDRAKLLRQYKQERHKLIAYKTYAERLQEEIALIESSTEFLDRRIEELSSASEYCCVCGCTFDEEKSALLWNENEGDLICSGCHAEFLHKCADDD